MDMNYQKLADLLFPQVTETPEECEARFPARALPEGAKVTRFAPSPTGFVHFGGLFPVMVGERLAHQSGGVFYLRIEDTDAKREVPGAAEGLITTLERYGIRFDEGAILGPDGKVTDIGDYGPYKQSLRAHLYHVFAKKLVAEGKAYPVFTTEEELEALKQTDKKAEIKSVDWEAEAAARRAEMLSHREFTMEDVEANLAAGNPWVLRLLSDGDGEKKITFQDLVRGKLEMPVNDEDFVLLKSDGIPTYHFAHAVDDHLMGTTHVIRGEEWLPSLPKHLQLFRYLGFRAPKYLHTAQVLRLDENGNKKKLSKRDMGAKMEDYDALGYPPVSVIEYLMTLLNSNYEEWHAANPTLPYTEFPVTIKKLSTSGCLFDFNKLDDVSKNVISRMTAEEVYAYVLAWAKEYDAPFAETLEAYKDRAVSAFAIGRGGKKPRKDFATWAEAKKFISFFFPSYYAIEDEITGFAKEDIKAALTKFEATYSEADDSAAWFDKVKAIAEELGYCSNMKEYKANPDAYPGNVGDISTFIRVALTGRTNSPDLYTVMQILGREEALSRIHSYYEGL